MPRDAVIRAITRLRDHNVFTRIVEGVGENELGVNDGAVELRKFPLKVRLVSCIEMCTSTSLTVSSGCRCKLLYDSTKRVVITAEKRPACFA